MEFTALNISKSSTYGCYLNISIYDGDKTYKIKMYWHTLKSVERQGSIMTLRSSDNKLKRVVDGGDMEEMDVEVFYITFKTAADCAQFSNALKRYAEIYKKWHREEYGDGKCYTTEFE